MYPTLQLSPVGCCTISPKKNQRRCAVRTRARQAAEMSSRPVRARRPVRPSNAPMPIVASVVFLTLCLRIGVFLLRYAPVLRQKDFPLPFFLPCASKASTCSSVLCPIGNVNILNAASTSCNSDPCSASQCCTAGLFSLTTVRV